MFDERLYFETSFTNEGEVEINISTPLFLYLSWLISNPGLIVPQSRVL